jgi:hypothetical protein
MNLKTYNKLVAKQAELYNNLREMEDQYDQAQKAVAQARKEIRNQVKSTFKNHKASAVMEFNGRILKLRINKFSVVVTENSKEIGRFRNGYEAEFAFATGKI